jgi:peptidoglycan/LPS O-acetylase OafA/YrhL
MKGISQITPLTSIRGLAAWWVAIYHFREYLPLFSENWIFAVIARGFYAVDLFFILSGFVIQLNYSHLFAAPNIRSLREFAIARFARVYPLHLFIMGLFLLNPLAIAIFSQRGLDPAHLSGRYNPFDYILSLFLIQNWGFRDQLTWNIPAWSISTEFAAYILFPIVSYLTLRWVRGQTGAIFAVFACLSAVSLVFWSTGTSSLGNDITRLGLPRCILEFMVGMMLCNLYQIRGAPNDQSWCLICAAVIFAFCFVVQIVPDYVAMPAAFAFIVFGLTSSAGPLSQLLSVRPLIYLGEISYATYLCHFFIKDWVKFSLDGQGVPHWLIFSVFVAATLLVSAALYVWIEMPTRKGLRALANRPIKLPILRGS